MKPPFVSLRFILLMGWLYVWRSWRSTLVLGVMVFSAVAALVFLSSLAVGTNDAMVRNSVGLFSGHMTDPAVPENWKAPLAAMKDARHVLFRRQKPALLEYQGVRTPVILMGIRPDQEKQATALWKKTVEGRFPEPEEASVYLSESESGRLGARVGEMIRVRFDDGTPDLSLLVCGIYRTGISALDQGVAFCPSSVFPEANSSMSVAVFLREGADAEVLRERIFKDTGLHLATWPEFMPALKQLIELNYVSMGIVMVLVFGIVSLGISGAFVIFIIRNLREHGVMKAMGIAPYESALLILCQVIPLTVFASLAGTAAGVLAVLAFGHVGIDLTSFTSHNQYFAVSGVIYPRLTAYSTVLPSAMALVFACVGTLWPASYVIRTKAADVLRSI